MHSWPSSAVPGLPGRSPAPEIFDTASGRRVVADSDGLARLYVCGITPYDSTHLGHAATYLAFDTLQRIWRDAGYRVHYAQNVTDVDDPLLERAEATGVDWRDLAKEQTDLFREDMTSLAIIPPDDYIAVTDVVDQISDAVRQLVDRGVAYRLPVSAPIGQADSERGTPETASPAFENASDVYFDVRAAQAETSWRLGSESNYDRPMMLALSAERGGDPERPGKHDPLDPLLWRAARPGEPSWSSPIGAGRPGWHIECAVIALDRLGPSLTVQGGGADLIFPHHELSSGHATALSGRPFARIFSHTGMVAYDGEKISKSRGNLVLVSRLRDEGADPRAIRLALLAHHYRSDWEWRHSDLDRAVERLSRWRAAAARTVAGARDSEADARTLERIRAALHDDMDTLAALREVDAWAEMSEGASSSQLVPRAAESLLGVALG